MAVFLTILKVLLWIVLIILGIVLLLILLVLFAPIKYRLQGEINSEKIEVSAKVSFLIISVLVNFSKAAGLDYMAKLLGIKVYPRGSDGKENNASHSKGKKSKDKKAKGKKSEEKDSEQAGDAKDEKDFWDGVGDDLNQAVEETTGEASAGAGESAEAAENAGETADASESGEAGDSSSESEGAGKKPKASVKDKAVQLYDKTGEFIEKTGAALEKSQQSLDKAMTKLDHVIQFLDKPFTQNTIRRVKKLIIKVFKTIKPKKSRANVRFGLSNAADTGEMLGKLSAFYPYYYRWLFITPDFYQKGVEGDFDIRGRITLAFIVFPALGLLISRDFRRTLKLAKKI